MPKNAPKIVEKFKALPKSIMALPKAMFEAFKSPEKGFWKKFSIFGESLLTEWGILDKKEEKATAEAEKKTDEDVKKTEEKLANVEKNVDTNENLSEKEKEYSKEMFDVVKVNYEILKKKNLNDEALSAFDKFSKAADNKEGAEVEQVNLDELQAVAGFGVGMFYSLRKLPKDQFVPMMNTLKKLSYEDENISFKWEQILNRDLILSVLKPKLSESKEGEGVLAKGAKAVVGAMRALGFAGNVISAYGLDEDVDVAALRSIDKGNDRDIDGIKKALAKIFPSMNAETFSTALFAIMDGDSTVKPENLRDLLFSVENPDDFAKLRDVIL